MDHLNDPNFDFIDPNSPTSRYDSFELERKGSRYLDAVSDAGTESHYGSERYLVSKAESLRTSTVMDFEEYVVTSDCRSIF
jgi:hypothetical protein